MKRSRNETFVHLPIPDQAHTHPIWRCIPETFIHKALSFNTPSFRYTRYQWKQYWSHEVYKYMGQIPMTLNIYQYHDADGKHPFFKSIHSFRNSTLQFMENEHRPQKSRWVICLKEPIYGRIRKIILTPSYYVRHMLSTFLYNSSFIEVNIWVVYCQYQNWLLFSRHFLAKIPTCLLLLIQEFVI
jgi:hypothetical protein